VVNTDGSPEAPDEEGAVAEAAPVAERKGDERMGYVYLAIFGVIGVSLIAAVENLRPFHTPLERALIIGESTREDWTRFEAAGGVHSRESSSFYGHRPFAATVLYDDSTGKARSFELRFSAMLSTPNAIRESLEEYCGSSGWRTEPNVMTVKGNGRECIVGYIGDDIYAAVLAPSPSRPPTPQRSIQADPPPRAVQPPRPVSPQQPSLPRAAEIARPSIPVTSIGGGASATETGRDRVEPIVPVHRLPQGWLFATINDPDGFTNVRSSPNGSASILGRVLEGQQFKVEPSTGDWWKVEVEGVGEGYMHRSRIELDRSGNN